MMSEPAASSAAVGDGLVAHGCVQSMHIKCRHGWGSSERTSTTDAEDCLPLNNYPAYNAASVSCL